MDTVLAEKGKRQLTGFHAKEFRYAGDDKRVAVVSAKGKIKAVGKGKCSVCVYARNGYENPCKWCGNAIYRGFGISYIKNWKAIVDERIVKQSGKMYLIDLLFDAILLA